MKDKSKDKYSFNSENLAVPEVHTGKVKQNDIVEDNDDESVLYDVAVPEVHIKKKKKK
ncbi:MAG: hypothetical protein PUC69_02205 [Ruminococcus sp.]|nr:hypothetical protein [Ruminococcus sp.]MDD5889413.1 hypothetical protein [Ruminococcus sp.]